MPEASGPADAAIAPSGRADSYFEELQREFPGLRMVHKADDALSRWIDRAVRLGTLGRQAQYLTHYTTVLGRTIYVPASWDERGDLERYVTLRHEAVHLRQTRRLGIVVMAFVYAIPFLPIGLAYGRARIEWEAYAETLRAWAEVHGLAYARSPAVRAHVIRQFTSAAYGWMWPFPRQVGRWIDEEIGRIGEGTGASAERVESV